MHEYTIHEKINIRSHYECDIRFPIPYNGVENAECRRYLHVDFSRLPKRLKLVFRAKF